MDVSEFHDTFFEEASELLTDMERELVDLDVEHPDRDRLDAIFRAAHSIKGGAGTFGFTALQNSTHDLEERLDLVRSGRTRLQARDIDTLLEISDLLRAQLACYRDGGVPEERLGRLIGEHLSALSAAEVAGSAGAAADARSSGTPPAAAVSDGIDGLVPTALRVIVSEIEADVAATLLEELQLFGEIVQSAHEDGRLVADMHPETEVAAGDIESVLCFVVDADQIVIEQPGDQDTSPAACLHIVLTALRSEEQPDLLEEVALFGDMQIRDRTEGRLELVLHTAQSAEDIASVLAFRLDASQIKIGPADDDRSIEDEVAPDETPEKQPEPEAGPRAIVPSADTPAETSAETAPNRNAARSESGSLRVATEKLDQIINLLGELVITQAMLERAVGQVTQDPGDALSEGMSQLARNARDLQDAVMSVRMVPMDFAFNRFPRLVRELGQRLGKEVQLQTEGGATELDKGLIERIMDPLTHLVRNSLDHGIEDSETRIARGKPAAGRLTLSARHEGGNVIIEIADDGAGLSRDRILAKAAANGLNVSADMPDDAVWQLIFAAGFSTAEAVSDISGRGVGMDVVKRNISQLGGHVDLRSTMGQGTTVRVVLPLTLAIMDGMAIRAGDEAFILPLGAILESIRVEPGTIRQVTDGQRVLSVRGEYLPVVALHRVFDIKNAQHQIERGIVIVVSSDTRRFALFVDELIGQQQVVVKNLETHFRRVAGVSAATILGDGSVALILDPSALAGMAVGNGRPAVRHGAAPVRTNATELMESTCNE